MKLMTDFYPIHHGYYSTNLWKLGIERRKEMDETMRNKSVTINGYKNMGQYGWICPICGRGVNPNFICCSCGGFNKFEITWDNTFDESFKKMTDFAKQTNYNGDKK